MPSLCEKCGLDTHVPVHKERTNCTRWPTRSMLRWLVENGAAPLKTMSAPAAQASDTRRLSNAVWRPRLRIAGAVAASARYATPSLLARESPDVERCKLQALQPELVAERGRGRPAHHRAKPSVCRAHRRRCDRAYQESRMIIGANLAGA